MKILVKGNPGILIDLIGYPWDRKKYGPPYLRMETTDGQYLGTPSYQELVKLQKIISICLNCERLADKKKRPKKGDSQ